MGREHKLEIARRQKVIEEVACVKSFRWRDYGKLPKGYQGPVEGYDQRIMRYNAVKSRAEKPPTGKPTIDKKSRAMAMNKIDANVTVWDRMHAQKGRQIDKRKKDLHVSCDGALEKYTKKTRNASLLKAHSEAVDQAWDRLYKQALKHHENVERRMHPARSQASKFVNKSSERMVSQMNDKRKPLYHIISKPESSQDQIQDDQQVSRIGDIWI